MFLQPDAFGGTVLPVRSQVGLVVGHGWSVPASQQLYHGRRARCPSQRDRGSPGALCGLEISDARLEDGFTEATSLLRMKSPSPPKGAALIRSALITLVPFVTASLACSSDQRTVDAASPPSESGTPAYADGATTAPDGEAGLEADAAVVDAGAPDGLGDGAEDAGVSLHAGKFVGNITTRRQVRSDFTQYWNQITPENEGKWGSVEKVQGTFNWTALDAIYKFAHENNVIFKQHCFVWGAQQPTWVNNDNGLQAVKNWITSFCQRYPDTPFIDVVNEPPPHTTPVYMDAIGGSGASGWDWIVNAFTWAREACPKAVLILNDYDNIENAEATQHFIDIVNAVKKAGAPVDAVGCQAHYAWAQPVASLKGSIDRIASETGLPVYITEYDIDVADDESQRIVMHDQFTMFWENPLIKGITLWGYVYGQTWMPNTGILRSDGSMRPAMSWLMSYLGR
jgi:endo-1,4-beta-xylanase